MPKIFMDAVYALEMETVRSAGKILHFQVHTSPKKAKGDFTDFCVL